MSQNPSTVSPLYSQVDASCLSLDKKEVYFFLKDVVVRFNIAQGKVIGVPQKLHDAFPGLPSEITAINDAYRAVVSRGGKIVFFLVLSQDSYFASIYADGKVESGTYETKKGPNELDRNELIDGENFKIIIYKNKIRFGINNSVMDINFGHLIDCPLTDVMAGVALPDGRVLFFKGDDCYDFDLVFKNIKSINDLTMMPPIPAPEKLVHRFPGLPLKHKIPESEGNKHHKMADDFVRQNEQKLLEANNSGKCINEYIKEKNVKTITNLSDIPGFDAAKQWAEENGYGVVWIGGVGEIGLVLSLKGITGLAYEMGTGYVKRFTALGAGVGLDEKMVGGGVTGFHKGGFDEFTGLEWGVSGGVSFIGGVDMTIEMSRLSVEGFYIIGLGGEEIGAEVELNFRYFAW